MMRITLENGEVLTWKEGKLEGNDKLVKMIESEAKFLEGTAVGPPTGPWTEKDHLIDPISTVFLLYSMQLPIAGIENMPKLPDTPEKAIL